MLTLYDLKPKGRTTELSAWVYLTEQFSKCRRDTATGPFFASILSYRCCGLCKAVILLREEGCISERVRNLMLERIYAHPLYEESCYIWRSFTSTGMKSRAAFCRKQVALLKKAEKQKRGKRA